jgi:DNA-binding transcriptional LysR family regulator
VLWPKLATFLPDYPGIKVEVAVEPGLTDIVAERFDVGVRTGDLVAKDMVAVPITPDLRMAVAAAPASLATHAAPTG